MATPRRRMDAARDQRYSWALGPLTPPAVFRYWAARVAARAQYAGRFANASYRQLAWGVAAIVMMLAALAESRWLRRIRRTLAKPAMKPSTTPDGNPPAAASPRSQSQAPPVKVTVTQAGVRVVDKRKAVARPAAAKHGGADAACEAPAEPRPADTAQEETRRCRAVTRVFDAVGFPMLGKLIRIGRRTPLPVASDADIGRYVWRRAACRQLLRGKPGRAEYLSELIDLAADETAGDWRSPVVWWVKRHVPPADLARFV